LLELGRERCCYPGAGGVLDDVSWGVLEEKFGLWGVIVKGVGWGGVGWGGVEWGGRGIGVWVWVWG